MSLEESKDMLGEYQYDNYENDPALKELSESLKGGAEAGEKMKNAIIESKTDEGPAITYDGRRLETIVIGSKESSGGIVMSAYVPEVGGRVMHRRFGSGKHGFYFNDGGEIPAKHKSLLQLTF